MILGYPFSGEILCKNDLVWIGFPIDISAKKCGIHEVKRRFAHEKLQAILRIGGPSLNHAHSVDGFPQWIPQMCPRLGPFVARFYAFAETKFPLSKNWQNIAGYELIVWALLLKTQRFIAPKNFLGYKPKNRDLHGCLR